MNHNELTADLDQKRGKTDELELKRLTTCYTYASADDKKVIWAVLNKYVPFLVAEGVQFDN